MEPKLPSPTPWYKRKSFIVLISIVGLSAIGTLGSNSSSTQLQSNTNAIPSVISQPITNQTSPTETNPPQKQQNSFQTTNNSGLSNDNYYTNTAGNEVHSPAYSNTIPAGASAQCRDGTYSFSQSRSGTCSHHGGVARWL